MTLLFEMDTHGHAGPPDTEHRVVTTPEALDHLNITGGIDKVVAVTRKLDLVMDRLTTYIPDTSQIVDDSYEVTGSQVLMVRGPHGTVPLGRREESETRVIHQNAGTQDISPRFFEAYLLTQSEFVNEACDTACDRQGHVIASSPVTRRSVGSPPLPVDSFAGNHSQYVALGLG